MNKKEKAFILGINYVFWGLYRYSFAEYFTVLASKDIPFKEQDLFLIESIGFIFSFS